MLILIDIAAIILPVFLVIALGYLLRHLELIDAPFLYQANRLIYFICLPSLLFHKIALADFHTTFNGRMVAGAAAALLTGFVGSYLYAALHRSHPKTDYGSFSQGAFRGNLAYIGLPVVFSAYGEAAFARAGMLMGCLVPVINLLAILAFLLPQRSASRHTSWAFWSRSLLSNPLVIAAMLGIVWSYWQLPLPEVVARSFDLTASITLPLALLAIGGSFSLHQLRGDLHQAALASLIKVIGLPLITIAFMMLLDVRGLDLGIAVLMAGAPAAAASTVLAQQLNGNAELAGSIILLSTLFSMVSYPVILYLLKAFQLGF
ncbi:MAG: AEC family transporter [Syntrophotaleaceae bacterium]